MAMNHPEFARLIAARLAEASLTIDRQCNRIRSRIWEFDDEFGGAPDIAPNWTGDILNDQELTGLAVSLIDTLLLLDEVADAVERSRDTSALRRTLASRTEPLTGGTAAEWPEKVLTHWHSPGDGRSWTSLSRP
jgi:hypothetical protein